MAVCGATAAGPALPLATWVLGRGRGKGEGKGEGREARQLAGGGTSLFHSVFNIQVGDCQEWRKPILATRVKDQSSSFALHKYLVLEAFLSVSFKHQSLLCFISLWQSFLAADE